MPDREKERNIFDPDQEFFLLSSDRPDAAQTRLYGFCIAKEGILTDPVRTGDVLTPDGAYVYVERSKNRVTIRQDYAGCYGLYLYTQGGYWALSNSFHYLVDKLKGTHPLTFHKEYADHLLTAGLAAQSYSETLVKEIELVDRAAVLTIDTRTGTIEAELMDDQENTLDLDSPAGMEALDGWVSKWAGLIRALHAEADNKIQTDLSGGYDSRIVLVLFLASGIPLADICVHSSTDKRICHEEDYRIASRIAEFYGFLLNDRSGMKWQGSNFSLQDTFAISFNLKLGFHIQMYYKLKRLDHPRIDFAGSGIVRDLAADLISWRYEDTFIQSQMNRAAGYGPDVSRSVYNILTRSFAAIRRKYKAFGRDISPEDSCYCFYRETRTRHHFGKAVVESYLGGSYRLCPLLDSGLNKLKLNSAGCADRNLLAAVVLDRYFPDLLDFEVEGGRFIEEATKQYARTLNARYPYHPQSPQAAGEGQMATQICHTRSDAAAGGMAGEERMAAQAPHTPSDARPHPEAAHPHMQNPGHTLQEVRDIVTQVFYSPVVKETYEALYGSWNYAALTERLENTQHYPEADLYAAIAISKVYQDCRCRPADSAYTVQDFVLRQKAEPLSAVQREDIMLHNTVIRDFLTARIDVKCYGEGNDLTILESSDPHAAISAPAWFAENGQGYVVESRAGRILLRIRCVRAGQFRIALRGRDVRDRENHRIPVWIDYTQMQVNGRTVFTDRKCAWHDKPYRYALQADAGEILQIQIAWTLHDERLNRRLTNLDP